MLQKPRKPKQLEIILRNKSLNFQNSCVTETGLSNFHRMVVTVMKASFERLKLRVKSYRDYKSFENKLFPEELFFELSNSTLQENADGLEELKSPCPSQTKVCARQPFTIYYQNPFKSNNA